MKSVDTTTAEALQGQHSGCEKPIDHADFKNRNRLLRALGKQGSPNSMVGKGFSPHNRIRTQDGLTAALGIFTYPPESRMYGFVRDTKTNSGHRWPEKPDDSAGLEQPVGGRYKDMPAGGYSAATWWKTTVRQVLFLTETREVLLAVSSRLVRGVSGMTVYSKYVAKRLGAKSFTDFSAAWPAHYSEILKALGTGPVPSQEDKGWVIASVPDFSKSQIYKLFKGYL